MASDDRIRTFIQGFDDKLSGGIPAGHIVLLAGEPGTMKSTIAFNVLYQNALREERHGTYISLEQGRDNLTRHLASMSLSPADVDDKVSVVDLGMIRRNLEGMADKTWLEIFKMYASNLKRTLNYEILVVDSLPVLEEDLVVQARERGLRQERRRVPVRRDHPHEDGAGGRREHPAPDPLREDARDRALAELLHPDVPERHAPGDADPRGVTRVAEPRGKG